MKRNSRSVVRIPLSKPRALGLAIAGALASAACTPAQAFEFAWGEDWTGNFDTTISYGVSQRVQDRDGDLIGKAQFNPAVSTLSNQQQRAARGRFSVNGDDGNLNYDDGDLFSNAIKITSELKLNWGQDWGAFFRATYFYDFENENRDELTEEARNKVGSDFKLLDAFIFHNYHLAGGEGTVRLGSQVVS